MRKAVTCFSAAAVIILILCLFFIPFRRKVNDTFVGYIMYKNGKEIPCSVALKGEFKNYILQTDKLGNNQHDYDHFDGYIYVNDGRLADS